MLSKKIALTILLLVLMLGVSVAWAQETGTVTATVAQVSDGGANLLDKGGAEVDWPGRIRSFFGLFLMLGIALLLSNNRRSVSWRLVGTGVVLQIGLGVITLSGPGQSFFEFFNEAVTALLSYTEAGSSFVFGNLIHQNVPVSASVVPMPTGEQKEWIEVARTAPLVAQTTNHWARTGSMFAFSVLPTIIFFSSLMAVLYHLGVMQFIVRGIAIAMQKTMRTSGAETLSAAGNIFVGQTEAPLLIRPFVKDMTQSELMAVMTGGFATVAGGVMVAYVSILKGVFPDIAGHLLCASIMSAPAALVVAKLIIPEPDPTQSKTFGKLKVELKSTDANVIDAAARGAGEGLKLALNVGAMLLAFIALIAMLNGLLGWASTFVLDTPLTLELLLGYLLSPLAWAMGVPWEDAQAIGSLLGQKTVLNEFYAYLQLKDIAPILEHKRSLIIATYALCGFANFGSIAIQLGGISPMAPERRSDLARIGLRAMIGGTLAGFMTACVIGMLI